MVRVRPTAEVSTHVARTVLVSQLLASPRAGDLQYLMASVKTRGWKLFFWNSLLVLWLILSASTSGVWIQSLVGELRSPKPCGMAKKTQPKGKTFSYKRSDSKYLTRIIGNYSVTQKSSHRQDVNRWAYNLISSRTWRRKWQPTLTFLPRELHGQRGLAGCSPWGHTESDATEQLTHTELNLQK